jgi:hypothetical protein
MHKSSNWLAFATIGVICSLPIAAAAQSQERTVLRCPAGYWLMQSLCLNSSTGDVVYAEPAAASRVLLEPGCAPGYWRLDSQCHSPATGDVELVDEERWPASQHAEARK